MRRVALLPSGAVLALVLLLGACSSATSEAGSATASSGPVTGDERHAALLDELRQSGVAAGASPREIECVVTILSKLSADELQLLNEGSSNAATQEAIEAAAVECVDPAQ